MENRVGGWGCGCGWGRVGQPYVCHRPSKNQIKQLFGEDKIIENWPENSPGKYDFINFRHKPYRGLMGNRPRKSLRKGI